jgi:hypothetical protein
MEAFSLVCTTWSLGFYYRYFDCASTCWESNNISDILLTCEGRLQSSWTGGSALLLFRGRDTAFWKRKALCIKFASSCYKNWDYTLFGPIAADPRRAIRDCRAFKFTVYRLHIRDESFYCLLLRTDDNWSKETENVIRRSRFAARYACSWNWHDDVILAAGPRPSKLQKQRNLKLTYYIYISAILKWKTLHIEKDITLKLGQMLITSRR